MTVISPATWMEYGSYDSRSDRLHIGSLLSTAGGTRSDAFTVTQQIVPTMVLTVSSGSAYIDNTFAAVQGAYCFINDAPITVTVQPSDPTFPRIDRVIARVYDAYYSGTENKAQIEITKGNPAVSPVVPELPPNSIELARISVAANATTIVTANINNAVMPLASLRESLVQTGLGSVGWSVYTPTFQNFTLGASTVSANYKKLGNVMHYAGLVTLGAGFSLSASPLTFSLPSTLFGVYNSTLISLGTSLLNDAGTSTTMGMISASTASACFIRAPSGAAIGVSTPFTWVVGDSFSWNMTYETVA